MGNNELFIWAQPREEKLFGEQEGFWNWIHMVLRSYICKHSRRKTMLKIRTAFGNVAILWREFSCWMLLCLWGNQFNLTHWFSGRKLVPRENPTLSPITPTQWCKTAHKVGTAWNSTTSPNNWQELRNQSHWNMKLCGDVKY